jgi:hypothetical protein
MIRAEIIGTDRCTAEGYTARSSAPVLALCRKLIDADFDPERTLRAYPDPPAHARFRHRIPARTAGPISCTVRWPVENLGMAGRTMCC